ncbi:uncharacterized protein LOC101861795 [Aplysia californica]|uniref:Uncharacterized protein LOC101861795 n=1 Tax=Aplysia californica TaxID=6500 RepID=A0ABM0ZW50_APLCA|nr:uncharacterized protein LOC101861795 [Aplysia californica]
MTGKIYKEGERWTYGCDYNCLCIDGSRGLYVCNDVCKHFVCPASYHCTEYEDPDYACCKLLKIEVATLPPPSTTLAPTTTEKVKIGSITCPQYYNLPTETCQYVEDPSDPCCKIPICHAPDDTTQNPLQPVQLPSGGFEVTAAPGTSELGLLCLQQQEL